MKKFLFVLTIILVSASSLFAKVYYVEAVTDNNSDWVMGYVLVDSNNPDSQVSRMQSRLDDEFLNVSFYYTNYSDNEWPSAVESINSAAKISGVTSTSFSGPDVKFALMGVGQSMKNFKSALGWMAY